MVKNIILEAINKNPMGVREAFAEELRSRLADALIEREELDELSKATLRSYKDKATNDFVTRTVGDPKLNKRINGAIAADKKIHGTTRNEEVEELSELSKSTLGSYINKAADNIASNAYDWGKEGAGRDIFRVSKYLRRTKGIKNATNRLVKEENLDETAYEKDLEDHEPRIVSGVKGMKSTPFSKKFRNAAHMDKWMDSDDFGNHEVHHVEKA